MHALSIGRGVAKKQKENPEMSYEVQEVGEYTRRVQVVVPVEEYKTKFNRALRQLSKRVTLAGFRKGKIPMSVMKQQYGPAVRQDVIEELVRTSVNELLEGQEDVIYLDQPEMETLPSETQALKFKVEFEISPKLDPVGYMGVDVGRPSVKVAEADLDAKLQALRLEHAVLEPVELRDEVKEGDIVTLDFRALASEPKELEQFQGKDLQIEVGKGMAIPGLEEALVGAKFGSRVKANVTLNEAFPVMEFRGKEVELELNIKSVKKRVLPELDDEFAADTGQGTTLIELRAKLREELKAEQEDRAHEIAIESLIDTLLKTHPFEVPEKFFDQQLSSYATNRLQLLAQQGIDPDQFGITPQKVQESARETLSRQLKWEFLLGAIARAEKIEVSAEDLTALLQQQALQMGTTVEVWLRYVQSDQSRISQAMSTAMMQKTTELLLEHATIKEVEWPVEAEEE